jgi:hypothetical protein
VAAGGRGIPSLPAAPGGYLLFLVVPAVATVMGGLAAARRAGAPDRRIGAAVGGLAGVVFAVFLSGVGLLSTLSVRFSGHAQAAGSASIRVRLGPDLLIGTLVALAWGLVGGAIGGMIRPGAPPVSPSPIAVDVTNYGFGADPVPEPPPPR